MNKILLLLTLFLSQTAFAKVKYYDAKLVFSNGTSKTGLAEASFREKYVRFKASKEAKVEEIKTSSLSKIIYTIDNNMYEYHQLKIKYVWKKEKIAGPMWLQVIEKGTATLYLDVTTMSSWNGMNSARFKEYYCIRPGESAARLISVVSTLNNNATFKTQAPDYFKDYPALANKIKSKQYTWKDIITVVQEYNKWAKNKKK